MRQVALLLYFFTVVLFSCNIKRATNLLSPNNLKSYFVTINGDSGYTLKTPNRALINISPGSFNVPANTPVTIEIKEAYTMQDILLAGLSTESNGAPLRSSGMLYFRATANNKDIKFVKSVQAKIPSKNYDSSMQVYKGGFNNDSTINWQNPKALDTSDKVRNILNGKALFRANCANCHKPTGEYTGPGLAGARQRAPSSEWIYRYVNNPSAMTANDRYARYLYNKYKPTIMTSFPQLRKREIKSILDYCDNEASLISTNSSNAIPLKGDTATQFCGYDTFYFPKLKNEVEVTPLNVLPNEINFSLDSTSIQDNDSLKTPDEKTEEEIFVQKGYNNVMIKDGVYQFSMDQSGWYNIDVLFNEPDAVKVKLFAKIQGREYPDMAVYLCIPKRKILMNADKRNSDVYIFHYSDADGYLPMILNDNAIIFAMASIKNKTYYGIQKFTIKEQQTVLIEIKESTKEQILAAFMNNQLDSIKLDIDKKEMEIIKRPCDDFRTVAIDREAVVSLK